MKRTFFVKYEFMWGGMISWSRPDPDLPDFEKSRKPDLLISTFFQIKKSWSSNLDFLISTWSRPDLERINGQLFSPMNKGRKSSNLMKSIREKIILLQYVHEFLKLLGKRLCLFDMASLQKDYTCTILHLWNLFMNFLSNNQNYTK